MSVKLSNLEKGGKSAHLFLASSYLKRSCKMSRIRRIYPCDKKSSHLRLDSSYFNLKCLFLSNHPSTPVAASEAERSRDSI